MTTRHDLEAHGLRPRQAVHRDLVPAELCERAIRRNEALLTEHGALAARTGLFTGRAAEDKYIVDEPESSKNVWWGEVNRRLSPEHFERLRADLIEDLAGRELFVQDVWAGADPDYRLPVRVITTSAWHSLFARNMFIVPESDGAVAGTGFTLLHSPGFRADPARHGTRREIFIVLNFAKREVLIGGTAYAGEIKKSIFTVLNYLLPLQGVLSMHCSANVGDAGDVALFFGLSGTGKTTLSADPNRHLIGDDEHGWSESGVFNFEGGNYAKVIGLSASAEPLIHAATRRFGTILENVVVDPVTRQVDFADASITENTRASYPISYISGAVPDGRGMHPRNVIFLTADAFGVLPPISRLTPEQAMYQFLSGYTAKVAGTEAGVKEPTATFSACFGAPFLALPPTVYAQLLKERLEQHRATCWLVNTGWTGGPYGTGTRIRLAYTRAMISAALAGRLDGVSTRPDPVFGLHIPEHVPDVPDDVLQPRNTWADPDAYDEQAARLAGMFRKNFEKFASEVSADVRAAGP